MRYDSAHITEIAGYRLTERLGSGGMGDVYKAYNAALNRTAAIKILHQKQMGDRFRNEAYIQSSVTHPNIARLYEYLVTAETSCIIMEYVEGEPLDVYLHKKGKLSNEETENIIEQIASALAYLHDKDILHRDIKPQNFKIQPNGTVTMLDFGIAKNKYTPKLTQQGYMVGTTDYMAPEQFRQQVEKKSDIWSLGVMAYELSTGYMPFGADTAIAMRYKIEKGEFTKPRVLVPAVSDKLNTVIEKCLQVNTANRLSANAVEMLLNNKKTTAAANKKTAIPQQLKVNSKTVLIAACMLLIIIVAIIIFVEPDKTPVANGIPAEQDNTTQQTSELKELTIDVTNTSNAYIVFPDGNTKKLPYAISGKEGESFQFTLQAEGFESKKIEVPISVGRKSYAYNLDKIKD
jgi:eukaryotic-like serine/threonine-protein kinase